MKKIIVIVLALCAAAIPLTAQDDIPAPINVIGGDEEALREFISLILRPIYAPAPAGIENTVLIGEMPDNMPIDLPVLEDARVVGSLFQNEPLSFQAILQTEQPAEAVLEFYSSALAETGWSESGRPYQGAGFIPAQPDQRQVTLCDSENNTLTIIALPLDDNTTDVRVNIQSALNYNPCAQTPPAVTSLIPELEAPEGVRIQGGGSSGGSSGEQSVSASLITDLSVDALLEHYNQALEDAGWTLVDSGSSGNGAWSTWTFRTEAGEDWSGTLFMLKSAAGDNQRQAMLNVSPVRD
jgi:hypothetical protein